MRSRATRSAEYGHVGYVRSFDDVANDIWTLVEDVIEKEYPGVPVIIHGHCMGGAHAMRALQLRPASLRPKSFVGCILSAPSYMIPPEAKPSVVIVKALGCLACCVPRVVVADWPGKLVTTIAREQAAWTVAHDPPFAGTRVLLQIATTRPWTRDSTMTGSAPRHPSRHTMLTSLTSCVR